MGAIKEKMFEIAELIQQMMDEGVKDHEIDEYLEVQLTPEDYELYHKNKDIIFNHFLGYMNESLIMPSLFEGCGCGKRRPSGIPIRRPAPRVKTPVPPKSPNKR
jgi:hypothetical protein